MVGKFKFKEKRYNAELSLKYETLRYLIPLAIFRMEKFTQKAATSDYFSLRNDTPRRWAGGG